MTDLHLLPRYLWAPGMDGRKWRAWAQGSLAIPYSTESPAIEGIPSRSLRRMNQAVRLHIAALQHSLPLAQDCLITSVSTYGQQDQSYELEREYHVEHELHPAVFSNSVYNAPVALATILLGVHHPYTTVFGVDGDVSSPLLAAAAPLFSGRRSEALVIVYEQALPEPYLPLLDGKRNEPFVYALKLTTGTEGHAVDRAFLQNAGSETDLLRTLIREGWL